MVGFAGSTFRCLLLTPEGKLLDCRAGSLVLPGYDGEIGVLRNHAPMLCKLGQGILQIKNITNRKDAFYIIDAGFARISENSVTILAYEVTTFEGMDKEKAEHFLSKAKEIVFAKHYIMTQREGVDFEKAALVVKMGRLYGIGDEIEV